MIKSEEAGISELCALTLHDEDCSAYSFDICDVNSFRLIDEASNFGCFYRHFAFASAKY